MPLIYNRVHQRLYINSTRTFCQMSAIMSLLLHLSLCHSERCEFRRMLLLLYHYHHFTGTPSGRRSGPARQECGELVTTHRDTFRGEALSSANAPSESVRRQQQRITCIPQGNNNICSLLHTSHSNSNLVT